MCENKSSCGLGHFNNVGPQNRCLGSIGLDDAAEIPINYPNTKTEAHSGTVKNKLLLRFLINAIILHILTPNTATTSYPPTTQNHRHMRNPPALSRLHNPDPLITVQRLQTPMSSTVVVNLLNPLHHSSQATPVMPPSPDVLITTATVSDSLRSRVGEKVWKRLG